MAVAAWGGGVTYTDEWRAEFRESVQSSAAALVPVLIDMFEPSSVFDVGCGEGWFVKEFERLGVNVWGVDGFVDNVPHVDLAQPPYPDCGPFDLVLCLEVAEHLPAEVAPALVDWLTRLAPLVAFSAATPGQGGEGHINEQPHGYWVDLFAERGYWPSLAVREAVADDQRISWWYRNNLMSFAP